jgi:predicted nucleotidyltransferase
MDLKDAIIVRLKAIEAEHNVRIVYACESGSRAWGFPSSDSDFDIRFIYIHPVEWYFSIDEHRDVIEYPLIEQLDVNGWDIRKAMRLFQKSNPPLMEWLGSPIRYLEPFSIAEKMRALAATYYSPHASAYHYLRMGQGNFREHLRGERVWVKKYFYVLRPILAINWIEHGMGVVPTEFAKLVEGVVTSPELRGALDQLLTDKRGGAELDRGPRIAPISDFIEANSRVENVAFNQAPQPPRLRAATGFREALREVWGQSRV